MLTRKANDRGGSAMLRHERGGRLMTTELRAHEGVTIVETPTQCTEPEALAAALAAALGSGRKDTWKTLVAALTLLGSERFEGWKAIAAGIGVSITRAR